MGENTLWEKISIFFKQSFCKHPFFDIEEWDFGQTITCIKCNKTYWLEKK